MHEKVRKGSFGNVSFRVGKIAQWVEHLLHDPNLEPTESREKSADFIKSSDSFSGYGAHPHTTQHNTE